MNAERESADPKARDTRSKTFLPLICVSQNHWQHSRTTAERRNEKSATKSPACKASGLQLAVFVLIFRFEFREGFACTRGVRASGGASIGVPESEIEFGYACEAGAFGSLQFGYGFGVGLRVELEKPQQVMCKRISWIELNCLLCIFQSIRGIKAITDRGNLQTRGNILRIVFYFRS